MNKLLSDVILLVIISTVLQNTLATLTMEEVMEAGKILRSHCQPQVGVSDESIEAASEGRFSDDRPLKCYLACMMELSHELKDGKYQGDMIIRMAEDLLPPEISGPIKNVVQKCSNAGDGIDDKCDIAMAIAKCAFDIDPELFFMP